MNPYDITLKCPFCKGDMHFSEEAADHSVGIFHSYAGWECEDCNKEVEIVGDSE